MLLIVIGTNSGRKTPVNCVVQRPESTGKETNTSETPALIKIIGKTTYIVNVHFSETARETVTEKLKRLIALDAELREG